MNSATEETTPQQLLRKILHKLDDMKARLDKILTVREEAE